MDDDFEEVSDDSGKQEGGRCCEGHGCGMKGRKSGRSNAGSLPLMALFSPDSEVNHLKGEPKWEKLEAVVDSGAAESVAPESMAPWVPMKASEGSKRGQTYMSASGAKLPNLGEET